VIVIVEVLAPAIEVGLKLTETPAGSPLADREMAELKPPRIMDVIVDMSLPAPIPGNTETGIVLGAAVRKKDGWIAGAVGPYSHRSLSQPGQ